MFLKGFEGWRRSRELQDELLDTLEAGLGADDVSLATLSDSGMVYWLADWAQGRQELRGHARVVVTGWVLGATTSYKSTLLAAGTKATRLQSSNLQDYRAYKSTKQQATRFTGLTKLQTRMLQGLQAVSLHVVNKTPRSLVAHKGPADIYIYSP